MKTKDDGEADRNTHSQFNLKIKAEFSLIAGLERGIREEVYGWLS